MRYLASEKLEIIQLVEQSHLPVCRTRDKLGIPRPTFYRWYDRYPFGGPADLEDHRPQPGRVRNRILDDVHDRVVKLALDEPTMSSRELGVRSTDTERYCVASTCLVEFRLPLNSRVNDLGCTFVSISSDHSRGLTIVESLGLMTPKSAQDLGLFLRLDTFCNCDYLQ